MKYELPSGKKITERDIFIAMTDNNVFNHHYLDIETGKVKLISEEFDIEPDDLLEEVEENNERYFEIPKIPEEQRHSWMKEFVKEMVYPENLREKLNFILSNTRDFPLFEKVLYKEDQIWGWVEWKRSKLFEELEQWFYEMEPGIEEIWEYDDDCPLCQLMKAKEEKGESAALEELKEAFKEATEGGNFAGGEWFEEDE